MLLFTAATHAEKVTVAAAADLKFAMDEIIAALGSSARPMRWGASTIINDRFAHRYVSCNITLAWRPCQPATEAARAFEQKTGVKVDVVFGGSGYVLPDSVGELSETERARLAGWYAAHPERARQGGEPFRWAFNSCDVR